jgi:hypothetical protein
MTWKEFKNAIESYGVKNDTWLNSVVKITINRNLSQIIPVKKKGGKE